MSVSVMGAALTGVLMWVSVLTPASGYTTLRSWRGGGGVRSTQGRRKSSVDVDGSNSENSDTAGLRTQHR
jgi:hypothetical protein